jgi:acyl carrier protein
MKENLEKEILEIISEVAECQTDEVGLDSNIYSELGIDSLKVVEIAVLIDRKFSVSIREERLAELITSRQIIETVKQLMSKKSQGL